MLAVSRYQLLYEFHLEIQGAIKEGDGRRKSPARSPLPLMVDCQLDNRTTQLLSSKLNTNQERLKLLLVSGRKPH